MQKKLKLATLALFSCTLAMAQNEKNTEQNMAQGLDENAFTFSEAQLGEDEDMSSNVTILNSSSNVYAKDAEMPKHAPGSTPSTPSGPRKSSSTSSTTSTPPTSSRAIPRPVP